MDVYSVIGAVVLFQKRTFPIGESRSSVLSTFEHITSVFVGTVIFHEGHNPSSKRHLS